MGGEDAGYGHVGEDTPGVASDCWGCHGFSVASAPGTGPVVPTIDSISPVVIVQGVDATITITGNAFTNMSGDTLYTSNVEITALDGTVTELVPTSISADTMTVDVNLAKGQ